MLVLNQPVALMFNMQMAERAVYGESLFSNNGKQEEGKYAQYGVVLSFLQWQHNVNNYGNASDNKNEAGKKSLNQ